MENEQIVTEASEWFVTLRETGVMDQATQANFFSWLCRSPEHVEAYIGIVALWSEVPGLPVRDDTAIDALVERARVQENVVPLASTRSAAPDTPLTPAVAPTIRTIRAWRALAACTVLAVAGLGVSAWIQRAPSFETAIGEQRTLRLADGSSVELNSRSLIRVRFTASQRLVELVQGQALFHVAKDANRAFVVSSDTARVRAVGTQFDVRRRKDGTTVTVVEGRVAVTDSVRNIPQSLLSAGQQLTVGRESPPTQPRMADVAAAISWTHGVLTFRSEPLSTVVDEFNRYNPRRIVLDDSVEDFPVTATFASTDSASLIRFLEAQPEMRLETSDTEIRVRTVSAQLVQ